MMNPFASKAALAVYLVGYLLMGSASPSSDRVASKLAQLKEVRSDHPELALQLIDDFITNTDLRTEEKGDLYYEQGTIYLSDLYEKRKALLSLYLALQQYRSVRNAAKQYRVLRLLGHTYNELNRHDYAIDYYKEIFSLPIEDEVQLLYTKYNIARSFRLNEQYDTAIAIQKDLVTVFKEKNRMIDLIDSHLELGANYFGLNQYENAQNSYLAVEQLLPNLTRDGTRYKSKVLGSLGFINLKKQKYQKAREYFVNATPLMLKENDAFILLRHYNHLGLLEMAEGNEEAAIGNFEKAIAFDPSQTDLKEVTNAFGELIEVYENKGKIGQALLYSRQLNDITLPMIELSKKLETLHNQYIAETAQYQIEQYELRQALSRSKERNVWIGALLIIAATFSVGLYFWYKSRFDNDGELISILTKKGGRI